MQATHITVLGTLQRVQRFMDSNAETLGEINTSGYRHILDDVVDTLSNHAVAQSASKRMGSGETAKQRVLRSSLKLNSMRPIAAVAAGQLKNVPEFAALKMPKSNATSARLIADAGAMHTAAKVYEQTFIDAGLPADFLDQLSTTADALNTSVTNRGSTAGSQVGATQGLKAESQRGRDAVKVLDALIEPKLAGNTVLLVQWNSAKKFAGKSTVVATTTTDAATTGVADIPPAATTSTTPTTPAAPAAPVTAPSSSTPVAPSVDTPPAA
jgi:hypothetical protein